MSKHLFRTLVVKLHQAALGFFFTVLVFFTFQFAWWQVYPYPTATIVEPMTVLNEDKIIKRPEPIMLEITIEKKTAIEPSVSRSVICGDRTYFVNANISGGSARPAGIYIARSNYEIPDIIPSGSECYFQFDNSYEVNPIRTIHKTWVSESFTVL